MASMYGLVSIDEVLLLICMHWWRSDRASSGLPLPNRMTRRWIRSSSDFDSGPPGWCVALCRFPIIYILLIERYCKRRRMECMLGVSVRIFFSPDCQLAFGCNNVLYWCSC